jgi:hypothetical protein
MASSSDKLAKIVKAMALSSDKVAKRVKLDKSLMREKLSLIYMTKDRSTGVTYEGVFEIGEKAPASAGIPDVLIRRTVKTWISQITVDQGYDCELWVEWNIPSGQKIIDFKFKQKWTYVKLSKNLGIPRFELNRGSFEITDYEIGLYALPIQATEL